MEALRYEKIEQRKKLNWWARFSLSLIIITTFLFLVWLLFYAELPPASRDLVNIMVGAYVAVLAKATDYWFKDKDDPEQKETENTSQNGNGNTDQLS
jgi:amino acid transporter